MSQTSFSPESPADRTTRLLGEALCAEVRLHPTKWPLAARKVAVDCIKWLGDEVESENCRRDNNGVRFANLNEKQSDTLHALYYEVTFEEAFEVTFD